MICFSLSVSLASEVGGVQMRLVEEVSASAAVSDRGGCSVFGVSPL